MKKILLGLIALILLTGAGAYLYLKAADASKPGIENFVVEDTSAFVYTKTQTKYKDLEKKYRDALSVYLKKHNLESDEETDKIIKSVEEIQKYVKEAAIVHNFQKLDNIQKAEELNLFAIINAGENYALIMPFMTQMFDKTEKGNYKLKEEVKAEILKNDISNFKAEETDIYVKTADMYFIAAFSEDKLEEYYAKVKSGSKNNKIVSRFKGMKSNIHEAYAVVDGAKLYSEYKEIVPANNFIENMGNLEIYSTFVNESYKIVFRVEGSGKIFNLLDSSKIAKRELLTYLDYNNVYFSNNNIANMITEINNINKEMTGQDYSAMVTMFTGKTLEDITKCLGDEILLKMNTLEEKGGILALKDTTAFEELLTGFGMTKEGNSYNVMGQKVVIEDNKAFYGIENKKSENNITVPNDSFLYIKIEFGRLIKILGEEDFESLIEENLSKFENIKIDYKELSEKINGITYEFAGKANGKEIGFEIGMEDKDIVKIMQYITKVLEDSSK